MSYFSYLDKIKKENMFLYNVVMLNQHFKNSVHDFSA